MDVTRRKRDNDDLRKIYAWFNRHNTFDSNNSLRSLPSDLTATENDNINCDDVESVGENVHAGLDNVCVENAKIQRKDQVKTLEYLRPGVKIDSTNVHINPLILFTHLSAILQRETDSVDNFDYNLTPQPTSLFKEGIMRKPKKAVFRNLLLDKGEPCHDIITSWCVVDDGALLHKVKWPTDSIFWEIVQMYVNYMTIKYGRFENICVVFDGYTNRTY